MMNRNRAAALGVGLALALAGPAWAAKPAKGDRFAGMDRNGDGVVDRQELVAAQGQRFTALDANKDGYLSAEELPGHRKAAAADAGGEGKRPSRLLTRLDKDKDGRISQAEFEVQGQRMLERLDKNKDGHLSRDELPQRRHG